MHDEYRLMSEAALWAGIVDFVGYAESLPDGHIGRDMAAGRITPLLDELNFRIDNGVTIARRRQPTRDLHSGRPSS